ncbi:MAG: helix-turn-helix transcriptional regulator [Bacteroidales bacterium]|nr:helix-turn-helix transcriptional regulator [Bacteroidales bacterium]
MDRQKFRSRWCAYDDYDYEEIFIRIDRIVREEKLFTDPVLTLIKVSKEVGTNRTYASRAISLRHKNFKSYLRIVRIEFFFKNILPDLIFGKRVMDVEELALMCGFNSRRALDVALMEHTGLTFSNIVYGKRKQ